jgi:hypothetical protein
VILAGVLGLTARLEILAESARRVVRMESLEAISI